jgi:3-hydroxyacyl-[acyl-carrier-protein] dehydratase
MLLVDEIIQYKAGHTLTATSLAAAKWPFFRGHFPGYPMLPGVILIEMMFQTCGLFGRMEAASEAALNSGRNGQQKDRKKTFGRAIKVDKTTFLKPVFPDTLLEITVSFKKKFMDFSVYDGKVIDETGDVVARGQVTVHLSKPKN